MKKSVFYGIIAAALIAALMGCDNGTTDDITVAFTALTANGSTTATTTLLTLTFDKDIEGLTAGDIELGAGTTGAVKGALTRTGAGTYTLAIGSITAAGAVTVSASKPGYTITENGKQVSVFYYADQIRVSKTIPVTTDETTVTGYTSAEIPQGTTVYVYVDPLEVETTNVIFDNLSFNRYTDAEQPGTGGDVYNVASHYEGDDAQGGTGNANWRWVVRKDGGAWQDLNHYPDWGDNWQYSPNPDDDEIYYSICTWEGTVVIQAGNKDGSKYEVGVAYTVGTSRVRLPDFAVISFGDVNYDEEPPVFEDPPGQVAVVIEFTPNE